jgi:tripartite-type tricarboxylate transporter receptor subunit TctC
MKRLAWILCLAATSAFAFPTKPVKVVVPYAAGTGPDIFTRYLSERLARGWGQQIVVENKPGASGFIAIDGLKNAVPDGHELLIAANGHTAMNPALYRKLPYDPHKDMVPVALTYRTPFFVAVSASGPYQSVPALIAAAKAKPGHVSYGTPYVGSPSHLGSAALEMLAGIQMLHVPFRDQNQAFVSIANGELGWMLSTYASAVPMMKAGRIKLLAIATGERYPSYPDIPTVQQAGGPAGMEVEGWIAFFGPRGVPAEVVRKVNTDVNANLRMPEVITYMRNAGWEPAPMTPEQLTDLIHRDTKRYADLVQRTGARID